MGVSTPDGKESAEDAIVRLEEELQQQRSVGAREVFCTVTQL